MPSLRTRALVIVSDGRKALFLDLTGTALHPHLQLRKAIEAPENPPTHEQGTDRPGRSFQSVGHMRSSMEQTDWHELGEQRFIGQVVSVLQALHQDHPLNKLVLIAPPRTLSYLRQQLPDTMKKLVQAEFAKDLVRLPLYEIESHLAAD